MANLQGEHSNAAQARRLAEEVVRRDDVRLNEALLADAIGHLADEIDRLSAPPPVLKDEDE